MSKALRAGIIPNPDKSGLGNSTYVSNFAMFVLNWSHYDLRFELRPDLSELALSESH
ncbi:MAG: hypothetical protein JW925_13690 [Syntrophaceae bacterium]|nr:hypothetical protein [Syntrophaceae bacterium]